MALRIPLRSLKVKPTKTKPNTNLSLWLLGRFQSESENTISCFSGFTVTFNTEPIGPRFPHFFTQKDKTDQKENVQFSKFGMVVLVKPSSCSHSLNVNEP